MRILYVEPYRSGSHASFTRVLTQGIEADWTTLTLPGRHWKWRMRGSAVWAALQHAEALASEHDLLLASSYLPLAELVGLCPRLAAIPRILYFHENQLTFPWRGERGEPTQGDQPAPRDHHFGFSQLVSALAATRCVFNSAHNRDGLLRAGRALLRRMPDAVPPGWIDRIEARSEVLPVPIALPDRAPAAELAADDPVRAQGPVIGWSHRWEHDKDPEAFFAALHELRARGVPFRVALCGQRFGKVPAVFERARAELGERVIQWGPLERVEDYRAWLSRAQLAVSTARHEFFGISMIEATHFGAYPLVPDRLAYPEVFPAEHRYADAEALVERLTVLCRAWALGAPLRADRRAITDRFRDAELLPRYTELFERVVDEGA